MVTIVIRGDRFGKDLRFSIFSLKGPATPRDTVYVHTLS